MQAESKWLNEIIASVRKRTGVCWETRVILDESYWSALFGGSSEIWHSSTFLHTAACVGVCHENQVKTYLSSQVPVPDSCV